VSIMYSECVSVVLVILRAKRMRRVILSLVASPAQQHFATLSHKRCDCRRDVLEHKVRVLMFPATLDVSHSMMNSSRFYHKCAKIFM
jgi:hypothetical protein